MPHTLYSDNERKKQGIARLGPAKTKDDDPQLELAQKRSFFVEGSEHADRLLEAACYLLNQRKKQVITRLGPANAVLT